MTWLAGSSSEGLTPPLVSPAGSRGRSPGFCGLARGVVGGRGVTILHGVVVVSWAVGLGHPDSGWSARWTGSQMAEASRLIFIVLTFLSKTFGPSETHETVMHMLERIRDAREG